MENKFFVVAGGCFWGVQAYYSLVRGVIKTTCGYTGGEVNFPKYEDVYSEKTGHTEAVKIEYDPKSTNIKKLLDHFFFITDPTTLNYQKNDIGTRYRSAIYYTTHEEKEVINEYINKIKGKYNNKIVTEIRELKDFWDAENYHQDYLINNPDGYCHIDGDYFNKAYEIDSNI